MKSSNVTNKHSGQNLAGLNLFIRNKSKFTNNLFEEVLAKRAQIVKTKKLNRIYAKQLENQVINSQKSMAFKRFRSKDMNGPVPLTESKPSTLLNGYLNKTTDRSISQIKQLKPSERLNNTTDQRKRDNIELQNAIDSIVGSSIEMEVPQLTSPLDQLDLDAPISNRLLPKFTDSVSN